MKLLAAILLALIPVAAPAADTIGYRLSISAADPAPRVTVTMTLIGDADGMTDLDLPNRWAGSEGLWRNIGGWAVRGGTIADTDKPEVKRIRHAPRARLTIRYDVTDPDPLPPGADYHKALPWIERDWITLHGEGVIVMPSGGEDRPARFAWGAAPKGWRVASDLDTPPVRLTANQVATGIFIGGRDLRLVERIVGGKRLRFALLGQWGFTDAQLADRAAAVIAAENAMLGAGAIPFVITLTPLVQPKPTTLSYGGTGRTAGFALTGTPNMPFRDLPRLLGHEYAHRWFRASGSDDARAYWLTEGFNDWFSAQAMLRTGDWDAARWVRALNAVMKRHATSPAQSLTQQERFDRFWSDDAAQQFPYDEGQLAATIIDAQLVGAGKPGLLPLLAAVNREGGLGDRALVEARIEAALPGAMAKIQAMLTRAGLASLPADLLPCGKISVDGGVPQLLLTPGACAALAGPAPAP
ncbi:MAG: hypothetical protein C0476_05915 [Sphingomonas sp.]|nr:hypothetical protein [Sphingomonas sp.]